MIGIRSFEESKSLKYNFGGIEKLSFYLKNICKFKNKIKINYLYFFSTLKENKNIIYKNLKFDKKIYLSNNKLTDMQQLYIMSKFNNFIISNSTFYFWGYFFAKINSINKNKIKILHSKKFINKNTII